MPSFPFRSPLIRLFGRRAPSLRACLLALVCALCPVTVVHAQATPAGSAARVGAPTVLRTAAGLDVYVERPQTVRVGKSLVLLGSPTFVSKDGRLVGLGAGAVRGPDGTARVIPLPGRDTTLMEIHATRDRAGDVHVVWGTRASTTERSESADTVWHAMLRDTTWRERGVAFGHRQVQWERSAPSAMIAGAAGPEIIAPCYGRNVPCAFVVRAAHAGGVWRRDSLAVPEHPNAVAAIATTAGTVVAYVVYEQGSTQAFGPTLYVDRFAALPGRSSPPRVALRRAPNRAVRDVQFVRGGRDSLWLLWSEGARGFGVKDTVAGAVSADGGTRWSSPWRAALPPGAIGLRALSDGGRLVLVAYSGEGPGSLQTACAAAPISWRPLPGARPESHPVAVSTPAGVEMFWGERGPDQTQAPVLRSTVTRPCQGS